MEGEPIVELDLGSVDPSFVKDRIDENEQEFNHPGAWAGLGDRPMLVSLTAAASARSNVPSRARSRGLPSPA